MQWIPEYKKLANQLTKKHILLFCTLNNDIQPASLKEIFLTMRSALGLLLESKVFIVPDHQYFSFSIAFPFLSDILLPPFHLFLFLVSMQLDLFYLFLFAALNPITNMSHRKNLVHLQRPHGLCSLQVLTDNFSWITHSLQIFIDTNSMLQSFIRLNFCLSVQGRTFWKIEQN